MAVIKSGATTDQLTVDPTSKAARVTQYDAAGNVVTSGIPVATTVTNSNVASSATNVTLLASNTSRRGASMFNDSTQAAYVKFGATATTSSFTYKVFPSQTLEFPVPMYTGIVDALWDSANGSMRIAESV